MTKINHLFKIIREGCNSQTWSQAVELVRQDAVSTGDSSPNELAFLVTNRNGLSSAVSLYPDDEDWVCDCSGEEDPCFHVAAAVIALRRAREQGLSLPKVSSSTGRLNYRFNEQGNELLFKRVVVIADGREEPLTAALGAIVSGRIRGPSVNITKEDMAADLALGQSRQGALPAPVFPGLLAALSQGLPVTLNGQPVELNASPVGILVTIRDEGPGVRLQGRQDPQIRKVYKNGVALCEGTGNIRTLRPVLVPKLDSITGAMVRDGRYFAPSEFPVLVADVLPALKDKVGLEIRTGRLPVMKFMPPRLEVSLVRHGETLQATPFIVYGEHAKISRGQIVVAKGQPVPKRMVDEELRLRDLLSRQLGLTLEEPASFQGEDAVAFVERLRKWQGDVTGEAIHAFEKCAPLEAQFRVSDNEFFLEFSSPGTDSHPAGTHGHGKSKFHAEVARVLKAWQNGESLVPLIDGGFAELPKTWLDQYGPLVLDLIAARQDFGEDGKLPPSLRPALLQAAETMGVEVSPSLKRLKDAIASFDQLHSPSVPSDLRAELRSYQKTGSAWLATLRDLGWGALLADDMGLGKTLQTITVMEGRTLVVAPTSVLFNWKKEIATFRPSLRVCLYHGASRALDPDADVIITTYALLRIDQQILQKQTWDLLVLDEAQAIKNPHSKVTRAAAKIKANMRIALSGTPVENRLDDLWSQMNVLNPGLLGSREHFQERYVRPIRAGQEGPLVGLRTRIKPFVLRRLKREVTRELPPRTDIVLNVELSKRERTTYEALLATTRKDVLDRLGQSGSVVQILEALLRLRQACCHTGLIPGSTVHESSKLDLMVHVLDEILSEDHKVLIFSQWTSFLDLMEPRFQAAGIPFLRLDGSTKDRQRVVDDFQREDGPPVLIMSLKAGGTGLNLTAADHVLIMDPWWNPAAEDQAADRAHRIGQERPVLVHRLVAVETVEERILELQQQKRSLSESVVGGASAAAALSRDDLLALLD